MVTKLLHQVIAGHPVCPKTKRSKNPNWPLHIKHVGRLDWEHIDKYISREHITSWREIHRCFTDDAFLEAHMPTPTAPPPCTLTEDDVTALLAHGIIEPSTRDTAKGWCNVFTVDEPSKRRRRLICEPIMNEVLREVGVCELCTDVGASVVEFQFAAQIDFPWYYGQFPLQESARDWYSFETASGVYRLTTIPTGSRQAPSTSNILTASLVEITLITVCEKTGLPRSSMRGDTYLDNVRFSANDALVVQALMQAFRDICQEAGVTLNDPSPEEQPTTEYDFLGWHCDHTLKTLQMTQKTREKLCTIPDNEEMTTWTLRDLMREVGLLNWVSFNLKIPITGYYYVFKMLRRKARATAIDDPCVPWPAVRSIIRKWHWDALEFGPRALAAKRQVTVFTDACLTGYGVFIIDADNRLRIIAGSFKHHEGIEILETRAVVYAAEQLENVDPQAGVEVNFFIDNTTTIAVLSKRRSAKFLLNSLADRVFEAIRRKGYTRMTLGYIPSKYNPADPVSRGLFS